VWPDDFYGERWCLHDDRWTTGYGDAGHLESAERQCQSEHAERGNLQ